MPVKISKMARYRAKNLEKMRAYERRRYYTIRYMQRRKKEFGDRRCKLCDILMASEHAGAERTRTYCGSCSKLARKEIHRLNMKAWRERQKKKTESPQASMIGVSEGESASSLICM